MFAAAEGQESTTSREIKRPCAGILFQPFLSARGLEPEAIAVVRAAGIAIRLVAAPLAGRIADRLDASRAVLSASIAGIALLTIPPLPGAAAEPAAARHIRNNV